MALLEDMFKGNPLTAVTIGIGAYLLAPALGQVLRPAAKALIKGGILAYQAVAEIGEMASDLAAEARAELDQPDATEVEAAPSTSTVLSRPTRARSEHENTRDC